MRSRPGGRAVGLALAAGLVSIVVVGSAPAAAQDQRAADGVCLEIDATVLPAEAWPIVVDAVTAAVEARPDLFPDPSFASHPDPSEQTMPDPRAYVIQISPGAPAGRSDAPALACLRPGSSWTVTIGRVFLDIGADRMLAEAPTTPGIDSEVEVEWHQEETRLRTRLHFAGPLDVPNGVCWIDDTLAVDAATGIPTTSIERGVETSLFAESACGRFFDHLVMGGAGEQAITLMPRTFELPDGRSVELRTESVTLDADKVVLEGTASTD